MMPRRTTNPSRRCRRAWSPFASISFVGGGGSAVRKEFLWAGAVLACFSCGRTLTSGEPVFELLWLLHRERCLYLSPYIYTPISCNECWNMSITGRWKVRREALGHTCENRRAYNKRITPSCRDGKKIRLTAFFGLKRLASLKPPYTYETGPLEYLYARNPR